MNRHLQIRFPQLGWLQLDKHALTQPVDGADLFSEGRRRLRLHLDIERNEKLRVSAKAYWRQKLGRLRCFACKFDFEEVYGSRGNDFIEMHHEDQLSATGETQNRPRDLKPLCSNCHRMVHRYPDKTLSLDSLVRLISAKK